MPGPRWWGSALVAWPPTYLQPYLSNLIFTQWLEWPGLASQGCDQCSHLGLVFRKAAVLCSLHLEMIHNLSFEFVFYK